MNQEIKEINTKIRIMKDKYTQELNIVNHYYWPIIAKIKRDKKNYIWYLSIAICLLISVILWILLKEIENEYWIAGSLIGCALVLGFTGFLVKKVMKKYHNVMNDWNKKLIPIDDLKEEIIKKTVAATEMMLEAMKDEAKEELDSLGESYEDVLCYYNHWVETV